MTDRYEMWAWLVREVDGTEGVVAAGIPGIGASPLQSRQYDVAAYGYVAKLARRHSLATGRPVRLVHLREVDE